MNIYSDKEIILMVKSLTTKKSKQTKNQLINIFTQLLENKIYHNILLKLLQQQCEYHIAEWKNCAIRVAANKGYTSIVNHLLHDLQVDVTNSNNYIIVSASRQGHIEIVRLLLDDHRFNFKHIRNIVCREAIKNDKDKLLLMMFEMFESGTDVDVDMSKNYMFNLASEYGSMQVIILLLSFYIVDPSNNNDYAIKIASLNGHTRVVEILQCNYIADSNKNGNYWHRDSIINASKNGHTDIVKLLLENRLIYFSSYRDAVTVALKRGHIDTTKLLLSYIKCWTENSIYRSNLTSLIGDLLNWSTKNNNYKMVEILLEYNKIYFNIAFGLSIVNTCNKKNYKLFKLLMTYSRTYYIRTYCNNFLLFLSKLFYETKNELFVWFTMLRRIELLPELINIIIYYCTCMNNWKLIESTKKFNDRKSTCMLKIL